ncbi:MAG: UGSC family (seleno)protein, partial [Phycisphaerales bacterium]
AEREGVPAFGVMTTRFASAAEMMGRVLGMPGYAFPVIEHPVSSATDDELKARARAAIEQGCKLLVKG